MVLRKKKERKRKEADHSTTKLLALKTQNKYSISRQKQTMITRRFRFIILMVVLWTGVVAANVQNTHQRGLRFNTPKRKTKAAKRSAKRRAAAAAARAQNKNGDKNSLQSLRAENQFLRQELHNLILALRGRRLYGPSSAASPFNNPFSNFNSDPSSY